MQKSTTSSDVEARPELHAFGGADESREERLATAAADAANPLKPRSELYRQTKAEETTRVAREIIAAEVAARERQRERLRAARLAKEAAEPPQPPKPAKGRRR